MTVYQTNALEFSVTSRLGGTQRNPPFSVDENDDDYVPPDAQNIRHFEVEELGIVDLSLIPGSTSIGARFVPWIWLNSPVAAAPGVCEVVDSETLNFMRQVFTTVGARAFYDLGVMVPQGASLRFRDWDIPAGGNPLRLRISLVPPANVLQWAEMLQAFCCLNPPAEEEE